MPPSSAAVPVAAPYVPAERLNQDFISLMSYGRELAVDIERQGLLGDFAYIQRDRLEGVSTRLCELVVGRRVQLNAVADVEAGPIQAYNWTHRDNVPPRRYRHVRYMPDDDSKIFVPDSVAKQRKMIRGTVEAADLGRGALILKRRFRGGVRWWAQTIDDEGKALLELHLLS